MSESSKSLTDSSLLVKNMLFNFFGQAFPALVALFSIPILINALGADAFGVLALAWMITGYFGMLDLGVSRSLCLMISEKLGRNDIEDMAHVVWTALLLTTLMGLFGFLILSFFASTIVNDFFKIPLDLINESEKSIHILAFSVPIIITSSALSGILQAYQRFDLVNIVRGPIGSFTFLGPVLVLPFSEKLSHIVGALVMVKLIESIINFAFCINVVPKLLNNIRVQFLYLGKMLRFGGWMTVSNIIGPLILYLDRFLIGTIISVTAVAYYTAPFEIVNRMMVIPGAIVGVLFPAIASMISSNSDKAKSLFFNGVKYTFIVMFPLALIFVTFAQEGLAIWLGDEFSIKGAIVLKWLIIGSIMSSLSYFPFALIHAAGRPDLTAKVHFIEIIIYLGLASILINKLGIEGAAIAWVIRASLDSVVLFYLAGNILNITYPKSQIFLISFLALTLLIISILFFHDLYFKLAFIAISLIIFFIFSWKGILDSDERSFVFSRIK